jgi:predicted permease
LIDSEHKLDRLLTQLNIFYPFSLPLISVTFPFFALVLCGFIAARRGMLPMPAIPGLNAFVLFFALPCMLYRFGASTPIAQ